MSYIENNPFDYDNEHRALPWSHLREFEKSYIIYQSQKKFYFNRTEISKYVKLSILHQMSMIAFPIISFIAFKKGLKTVNPQLFLKNISHSSYNATVFFSTLASWYTFSHINPFYICLCNEKEQLMRNLEYKISYELIRLNDILPNTVTENRINRRIALFHYGLNSSFNGLLFNTYEFILDKKEGFNNPFE